MSSHDECHCGILPAPLNEKVRLESSVLGLVSKAVAPWPAPDGTSRQDPTRVSRSPCSSRSTMVAGPPAQASGRGCVYAAGSSRARQHRSSGGHGLIRISIVMRRWLLVVIQPIPQLTDFGRHVCVLRLPSHRLQLPRNRPRNIVSTHLH